MPNPIKLYKKSQENQIEWIRKHPVQYIALNATLIGVFYGYVKYQERKDLRKFEQDMKNHFDELITK